MKAIDLFCGCGGLSLGFESAGIQIIKAFDNWEEALKIYNANFKHAAELTDIYELSPDYLKSLNVDMIIGGPPCQDYSSAGKRDESRGRANLTLQFAKIVSEVKPKWFVMENVDRIIKSETLPKAISVFESSGYGLTQIILDASKCGVPQVRKRFFLIGELGAEKNFLLESLIEDLSLTPLTVREYLGNELDTEFYYRHPRSYNRRAIFSIDEPSPTIRGVNRPIPPSYRIHPGDATKDLSLVRPLTNFERARIQTFPKDFILFGKKTDLEQIIGNAVPVNLAKYVAEHLINHINMLSNKQA
ncbi:MAG: DNA cytosine methyltransferase [Clostridia bacterium]|nr:DNA cytosine methyltransferase [Clostridia bacterium]